MHLEYINTMRGLMKLPSVGPTDRLDMLGLDVSMFQNQLQLQPVAEESAMAAQRDPIPRENRRSPPTTDSGSRRHTSRKRSRSTSRSVAKLLT